MGLGVLRCRHYSGHSDVSEQRDFSWFRSWLDLCSVSRMSVSLSEIQSPFILSLVTPEDGTSFLSGVKKKPGEPVTTQPGSRAGMSAITTVMWTGGAWSTGLFDVCSDKKVCVCGTLCIPCLECSVARRAGECLCFPLLPGASLALRVGARERHKIQGTIYEDWIAVYCCWPFAVCQVARELKRRAVTQICEVNAIPVAEDVLVRKIPSKGA